ncbi:hypothetical protein TNCV_5042291 [Trichonephila clavipes]|nr:hypothetical protein TNCV_5042291 [Trichonephila clavipes]
MIESGLWMLQEPRQLLNIANIQSRSWFGTEFAQAAKHLCFFYGRGRYKIKVYLRDILEVFVLQWPKSILEVQIGRYNKTLHQLTRPKRYKSVEKRIFQT